MPGYYIPPGYRTERLAAVRRARDAAARLSALGVPASERLGAVELAGTVAELLADRLEFSTPPPRADTDAAVSAAMYAGREDFHDNTDQGDAP